MDIKSIKLINYHTQRGQSFINSFNNGYKSKSLYTLYKNFSINKYNALRDCISRCEDLNGYDFRLLGGNSSYFTCGYIVPQCSKDTGEFIAEWLIIETYANTYKLLWLSQYTEKELMAM